jgi:hypothetical protein
MKTVPVTSETIETARDLGICFGDDPATARRSKPLTAEELPPAE